MSFIAKNPLTVPEVESSPSVPQTGTRGLFAGRDGWYDVDSDEHTRKIATEDDTKTKEEIQNKIPGGAKPITEAYADDMGMVNNSTYPSMKYLAESLEQFRKEIGSGDNFVEKLSAYGLASLSEFNIPDVDDFCVLKIQDSESGEQTDVSFYNCVQTAEKLSSKVDTDLLRYYEEVVTPTDASLFEYVMEGNTWCITGYTGTDTDVVIPYEINGISVTSIGSWAFWSNTALSSVTIPNSVTTIATGAFRGCSNLKSVTIPDSVISIGNDAFMDCESLKSITIPDSVTTIPAYMFNNCANLKSIRIPNSVTTIGVNAFSGCDALIVICDQGSHAEEYCKANNIKYVLDTVSPDSLGAGGGSVSLDNYYTKKQVDDKLEDKADKADVDLLHYYREIVTPTDASAFIFDSTTGTITGFSGIEADVVIPYEIDGVKVTTIGNSAFSGWLGLKSVIIPNNITTIGEGAFSECRNLENVTIGDGVITIGKNAFYNGDHLKNVTIGDSVTTIGETAFYSCDNLTSITIPDSVTTIAKRVFAWCSNLKNIIIPNSVTTIGTDVFSACNVVTVICNQGSYAETYCKTNKINYALNTINASVTTSLESAIQEIASLKEIIALLQAKSIIRMTSIVLPSSEWIEDGVNQYHQVVDIDDITPYSKVDLQPTTEQLVIFHQKDITFVTENIDGVITVYCIGQMPLLDYTIQATVTEVV